MSDETVPMVGPESSGKGARKGVFPKAALIMAGIVALGLTAGCGKKSDPQAPGPSSYPKTYPTS